MNIKIDKKLEKKDVVEIVRDFLIQQNFKIEKKDFSRPWGGFFVIDESDAERFSALFFSEFSLSEIQITNKLSPKILVVAPNQRLSWQYHLRRAEIWKVIGNCSVGIKLSDSDLEPELTTVLDNGVLIKLNQGERHRLIGLDSWGIIAEIWQHTNESIPSDEEDIVRVQDDFGR